MRIPVSLLVLSLLGGCGDEEPEAARGPDAGVPAARSKAATVAAPDDFIRFVEDRPDAGDLETAVVTYHGTRGEVVDLIAIVHLGDAGYYEAFERSFGDYDAVLYEMVKPADASPARAGEGGSPVSFVQRGLCRALELQFQLEALDYGRPNFVHADLTTEEFGRLWDERNESFMRLALRVMSVGGAAGTGMTPAALFEAARSKQRAARLKLLLAREFSQLERTLAGIGEVGEDGRDRSMLLGARNAAAVRALVDRLAVGDRRVAILYGAGHGPDLDLRLVEDVGLVRREVGWRTAWHIDARED